MRKDDISLTHTQGFKGEQHVGDIMFTVVYRRHCARARSPIRSDLSWCAADRLRFPFPPRSTSTARTAAHLYGRPVSRRLSLWLGRDECEHGVRARRTVTASRFKPNRFGNDQRRRNDCSGGKRGEREEKDSSPSAWFRKSLADLWYLSSFFSLSLSFSVSSSDVFPGARARLIAYVTGKSSDIDRHSIFRSMSEGSAALP